MNLSMKDRVAVVTGGSKGIGIAVARRFAESGAKVAILARGAADLAAAREALHHWNAANTASITKIIVGKSGMGELWRRRRRLTSMGARRPARRPCAPTGRADGR